MIGNLLIILTILSGAFTAVMYYYSLKGYNNTLNLARQGYYVMTALVSAASLLLLYFILSHQFQYKYVFEYSSRDLSLGLLLSTFFAGQEGSFLLWLLLTLLFGTYLINTFENEEKESAFMFVYTIAALFLGVLISPYLKNPFATIWSETNYLEIKYFNPAYLNLPQIQNFIVVSKNVSGEFVKAGPELKNILNSIGIPLSDFIIHGKGLNPLLQNFWMQIHPPLLFVGFAMASIPYSYAVSSLIRNEYKSWIKDSYPWLIATSAILGLALMIGGYWAYGVLGWGGFWAWDPVENSSLIPWLISVAAIHTFLVQKRAQDTKQNIKLIKTNLVLAILSFVFVIYSTFLTRSGILSEASVHSFVDPGQVTYLFLLGYLILISIIGMGAFFYRRNDLKSITQEDESIFNRENGLLLGAALLLGSALIIIVGTSAPIFGKGVEVKFYNQMNFPIAILIGILIAVSLFLRWKSTDIKNFIKQISLYFIISIIATAAILYFSFISTLPHTVFTFSVVFTIVVNLALFVKTIKTSYLLTGGHLAHIGVGIFLLGVLITGNYSQTQQIDLPQGKSVDVLNYKMKFIGYNEIDGGKKFAFNVKISDGNYNRIASPVMFISEYNNSTMREPDILEGIPEDIYIAPLGYTEENNSSDLSAAKLELEKGNSAKFKNFTITFQKFLISNKDNSAMLNGEDFKIGAELLIKTENKNYSLTPYLNIKKNIKEPEEEILTDANLKISLNDVMSAGKILLTVADLNPAAKPIANKQPTLSIEASVKPNISLVWLGVLFISLGLVITVIRRIKETNIFNGGL